MVEVVGYCGDKLDVLEVVVNNFTLLILDNFPYIIFILWSSIFARNQITHNLLIHSEIIILTPVKYGGDLKFLL